MPYGSILHIPPTSFLLSAKQEPYQKQNKTTTTKNLLLSENYSRTFWKKSLETGPAGRKKDKTERVTGSGRSTRQETVKWNQMTALRFQKGEKHLISPACLRGERNSTNRGMMKIEQQSTSSKKRKDQLNESRNKNNNKKQKEKQQELDV